MRTVLRALRDHSLSAVSDFWPMRMLTFECCQQEGLQSLALSPLSETPQPMVMYRHDIHNRELES